VGAVGLGHGPRSGAGDVVVLRVVGVVAVPGGDPDVGPQDGRPRSACLDRSMRRFGGVPTYWLTDNERTVTTGHVAGIAVRHPEMVAAGGHYGVTVETCVPADPESKGGVEATVRIAKADLVPTDAQPARRLRSWAELVEACDAFMAEVNSRDHRVTRRPPDEMLVEEQAHLHRLPERPYTSVFGETRRVRGRRRSATAGSPTRSPTPSPTRRCGSASMATRSCGALRPGGPGRGCPASLVPHRATHRSTTPTTRPAPTGPRPPTEADEPGRGGVLGAR
jgi:hypothetical protein